MIKLLHGDALDHLSRMPDNSVSAVITDPPYGLSAPPDMAEVLRHWLAGDHYDHRGSGFMGQGWDSFCPSPRVWEQVCRILRPGAHAVIFAGSRTVDLMGISCRLGGLTLRDCGVWSYYSGFPKSTSISAAIDRMHGAEREVVGIKPGEPMRFKAFKEQDGNERRSFATDITAPATEDAKRWDGWGSGIKPGWEPWLLFRKPLSERTLAANVLRWDGCGGLNIDAARFKPGDSLWPGPVDGPDVVNGRSGAGKGVTSFQQIGREAGTFSMHSAGRFPSNLIQAAKASRREREAGCLEAGLPVMAGHDAVGRAEGSEGLGNPRAGAGRTADAVRNHHPTVKPLAVMRYLSRLVGIPGGRIVDPFCGSGSTLIAAASLGFDDLIGIDLDADYLRIAKARIRHATTRPVDAPDFATDDLEAPSQLTMWR